MLFCTTHSNTGRTAFFGAAAAVKVAVALHGPHILTVHVDPLITTEQLPDPEQYADQPVKVEPVFAVAVSVTFVPAGYVAVPVLPFQVMVPVDGVTVPEPVPAFLTVRRYVLTVVVVKLQGDDHALGPAAFVPLTLQ